VKHETRVFNADLGPTLVTCPSACCTYALSGLLLDHGLTFHDLFGCSNQRRLWKYRRPCGSDQEKLRYRDPYAYKQASRRLESPT